jgi:hypothetical protein
MDSREIYRIGADGRGSVVQTHRLDLRARDALLREALRLIGGEDEPPAPPFADPVAPAWIRSLAARTEGYLITKAVASTTDGVRNANVEATFDTLEAAAEGGAFIGASVHLDRIDETSWKLTLVEALPALVEENDGRIGGADARIVLDALAPLLEGFRSSRTFTLPGRILACNGRVHDDGRTVTFTLDLACLQAEAPVSFFATFEHDEAFDLEPFRFHADPERIVERLLEEPPAVGALAPNGTSEGS